MQICPRNRVFVKPISSFVNKDRAILIRADYSPEIYSTRVVQVKAVGESDPEFIKMEYTGEIPYTPKMDLGIDDVLLIDQALESVVRNSGSIVDGDVWVIPKSPSRCIYAYIRDGKVVPVGFNILVKDVIGSSAEVVAVSDDEAVKIKPGDIVHFRQYSALPIIVDGQEVFIMDFIQDVVSYTPN